MTREIWLNLPVKDLAKSRTFFTVLGFPLNPGAGNTDHSASFAVGDQRVILMLFAEAAFEGYTQNKVADTRQGTEVLFSLGAGSREEVDEIAKRAEMAGGTVFSQPRENPSGMYGCGFADLDGHRWNVLYMDPGKLTKERG